MILFLASAALGLQGGPPPDVCSRATLVVIASATKHEPYGEGHHKRTRVTFQVEREIVGTSPRPLVLSVYGGEGSVTEDPRFPIGGRYFLVMSSPFRDGGPLPRMYQHGAPFGFDYPTNSALRATWDRMCASAPVIPEHIPDWFTFLRDAPRDWDLP